MFMALAMAACLGLAGQSSAGADGPELTVIGARGERVPMRQGAIGCGCTDPTHGGKSTPREVAVNERLVFLRRSTYVMIVPLENIDRLAIRRDRPSTGDGAATGYPVEITMIDGHFLEGRLLNRGPIVGRVAGRAVSIPLERVNSVMVGGRRDVAAELPVDPPAHRAELVVRTGSRRVLLSLSKIGFASASPCPHRAALPRLTGDSLRGTKTTVIPIERMASLYPLVSSLSRRKVFMLGAKLPSGQIIPIAPTDAAGMLAVAKMGKLDTLVQVGFGDVFALNFENERVGRR